MKLRSFTAPDMQKAMKMAAEALGEDALILSSITDPNTGKVTLTAATDEDDDLPPPPPVRTHSHAPTSPPKVGNTQATEDWLDRLQSLFRFHGTPEPLAGRLVYKARQMDLGKLFALEKLTRADTQHALELKALSKLLEQCFSFAPLEFDKPGTKLMLVGAAGAGKTLTCAKLLTSLTMARQAVEIVSTDTRRAGGIAQLQAFADILEHRLHVAESPEELQALLQELPKASHVLIDTAGTNLYDSEEREELTDYLRLQLAEPIFVLPAGGDAHEAAVAARYYAKGGVKRLAITRADTTRRFGSVLAAADAGEFAFCLAGAGASVTDEPTEMRPETLAQWLLQYTLQTSERPLPHAGEGRRKPG